MFPAEFHKRLVLIILALAIVIVFRLGIAATETGNWRGFYYSLAHVLLVGGATYYFLRDTAVDVNARKSN